jgi:V8-like Glu-specific endopeptidase
MSTTQNSAGNTGCGCAKSATENQRQNLSDTPGYSPENPNAASSSDGGSENTEGAESSRDQIASSFDGEAALGELELLAGFDPQKALADGMPRQILTDEFLSLGECRPEGYSAETVCGPDDRVQIGNTTVVPWRWLCKLIITWPNGAKGGCTGWFIGPKAVMTAGHCVYSKANGGWARQIEVIPGMHGALRPFGSMVGTSFRSVTGWTSNTDPNFDYGCVILPNPSLGNAVGWFGFASLTNASLTNLLVNHSGYPGDKPAGTQWFNAGRVSNITTRKIYYMLDTFNGQSGCPTWRTLNGQRHAVGIHAYGGCPNSATRITSDVFNNMNAWRNL